MRENRQEIQFNINTGENLDYNELERDERQERMKQAAQKRAEAQKRARQQALENQRQCPVDIGEVKEKLTWDTMWTSAFKSKEHIDYLLEHIDKRV